MQSDEPTKDKPAKVEPPYAFKASKLPRYRNSESLSGLVAY